MSEPVRVEAGIFAGIAGFLTTFCIHFTGSKVDSEYKIIREIIATLNYFCIFNRWWKVLF